MSVPPQDDDLTRARAGDTAALTALLERYTSQLRADLAARLPQRHQAVLGVDDVLQQTCVDAFHDLPRFVGGDEASFAAWLHTLARRNIIDAVRMLDTAKRGGGAGGGLRLASSSREDSRLSLMQRLPGMSATPSRAAARQEACAALEQAVAALPQAYREVVQRFDLQGQPIDAVAEAIGRSRGAAYMIRARAHRMLADLMGRSSNFFTRIA